jgi:hypothetical protein
VMMVFMSSPILLCAAPAGHPHAQRCCLRTFPTKSPSREARSGFQPFPR